MFHIHAPMTGKVRHPTVESLTRNKQVVLLLPPLQWLVNMYMNMNTRFGKH